MQIGHQARTPDPLLSAEEFNTLSTVEKYHHVRGQIDAYNHKTTTLQGVVFQHVQGNQNHPDYQTLQHQINLLDHHYQQVIPHAATIHQFAQFPDAVHDVIGDAFDHLHATDQLHTKIRGRYGITVSSDIDDSSSGRTSGSDRTDPEI